MLGPRKVNISAVDNNQTSRLQPRLKLLMLETEGVKFFPLLRLFLCFLGKSLSCSLDWVARALNNLINALRERINHGCCSEAHSQAFSPEGEANAVHSNHEIKSQQGGNDLMPPSFQYPCFVPHQTYFPLAIPAYSLWLSLQNINQP